MERTIGGGFLRNQPDPEDAKKEMGKPSLMQIVQVDWRGICPFLNPEGL